MGLKGGDQKSIHQVELELNKAMGISPDVEAHLPNEITNRNNTLNREVFGYYPYWMGSAWLDLDLSLISTIAYFELVLDATTLKFLGSFET